MDSRGSDTAAADYAMHDAAYRHLRARGATGWDSAADYAAPVQWIESQLGSAETAETSGLHILEIGCGAGQLSAAIAGGGRRVIGVDISPTAIAWARERTAGSMASFIVADVRDLGPIESASMDVVVDGHCLHCIVGVEDRRRCLAAVKRVLRPGGRFLVMTMCGAVLSEARRAHHDAATGTLFDGGLPVRHIAAAGSILEELQAAGFLVDSSTVVPRASADEQDDLYAVAIAQASP